MSDDLAGRCNAKSAEHSQAANALSPVEPGYRSQLAMPRSISAAGKGAKFAWEEFFLGKLRNAYTRRAYLHAVRHFLGWAERRQIELPRITPGMVGQYFDDLTISTPSKKLYLAAIRSFLDVLVQRHVIILNPALSVRTERYSATEGKTPEITVEQSRQLLNAIPSESVIDLRDRALIATLIYTAARAGAVAKLRLKDLEFDGVQFSLKFNEGSVQKARRVINSALSGPDDAAKAMALALMVTMDVDRGLWSEQLLTLSDHDDATIQILAIVALSRVGALNARQVRRLVKAMRDPYQLATTYAASALIELGLHTKEVWAVILDLLQHGNPLAS